MAFGKFRYSNTSLSTRDYVDSGSFSEFNVVLEVRLHLGLELVEFVLLLSGCLVLIRAIAVSP